MELELGRNQGMASGSSTAPHACLHPADTAHLPGRSWRLRGWCASSHWVAGLEEGVAPGSLLQERIASGSLLLLLQERVAPGLAHGGLGAHGGWKRGKSGGFRGEGGSGKDKTEAPPWLGPFRLLLCPHYT